MMHMLRFAFLCFVLILLPETSFGLRILLLPVSVYVSVCVCVSPCPRDNSWPVQASVIILGTERWAKILFVFGVD